MRFFRLKPPASTATSDQGRATGPLCFASTAALEQALDGTDESFNRFYFALYQCAPAASNGIQQRREQLRQQYPDKAAQVGRHFVLFGEPAFKVLSEFYSALEAADPEPEAFRVYVSSRLRTIAELHRKSQELPVPINLSEGQLGADSDLDFYVCTALFNGQIVNC